MKRTYTPCVPSKLTFREVELKTGVRGFTTNKYSICQYRRRCCVGLSDTSGTFKYVDLNKRVHSSFQVFVGTGVRQKPMNLMWETFELYHGSRVLFVQQYSNKILETSIPSRDEQENAIHIVGGHDGIIKYLSLSPYNPRTFVTGTENGEIKVWHIVLPEKNPKRPIFSTSTISQLQPPKKTKVNVPCVTNLWTFKAFPTGLDKNLLFHSKQGQMFNFLLLSCGKSNRVKIFDLKRKVTKEETIIDPTKITAMKKTTFRFPVIRQVLTTINARGIVSIFNLQLKLLQTLYLELDDPDNWDVVDFCTFSDPVNKREVLVVAANARRSVPDILRGTSTEQDSRKCRVRFVSIAEDRTIREFVLSSRIVNCEIVKMVELGKQHLILGDEDGQIKAWCISELFSGSETVKMKATTRDNEKKPREVEIDDLEDDVPQPSRKEPPSPSALFEMTIEKDEDSVVIIRKKKRKSSDKNVFDVSLGAVDGVEVDEEEDISPRSAKPPAPMQLNPRSHAAGMKKQTKIASEVEEVGERTKIPKFVLKEIPRKKKRRRFGYSPPKPDIAKPEIVQIKPPARKGKNGDFRKYNYGDPDRFMAILQEETVQNTNIENDDVSPFSKKKQMSEAELKQRIAEIKNREFDADKVVEKTKRDMHSHVTSYVKGKRITSRMAKERIYDNLVSIEVKPHKFVKVKKKVKRKTKKNRIFERNKPRLDEFFFPDDYEEEFVSDKKYMPKIKLKPIKIPLSLELSTLRYGMM